MAKKKTSAKRSDAIDAAARAAILRAAQAGSEEAFAALPAITAADVRRFENDSETLGSNILMAPGITGTLENCASVAEFLWYYQGPDKACEMEPRAESGLTLIMELQMDALSKQLDMLEPGASHD
jgi:hypothetical protein